MFTESLIVLAGFLAILITADLVVRSTLKLSKHFGLSGSFVGLTILSIGTSIPEIMSAVVGSVNILGKQDSFYTLSSLVLGQNVGSDIFQQSFILAMVGIFGTIIVVKKELYKEVGALIAGTAIVWLFALGGVINRIEGALLLIIYTGYLLYLKKTRVHEKVKAMYHLNRKELWMHSSLIVLLFIVMAFSADKVLDASSILISSLPISASFFGVVLLGVASALPELTTAIVGLVKKEKGISTGVLIGSNITNPFLGIGLGATISTYAVPSVLISYDIPFKIGTAMIIFYFLHKHSDLKKWQGALLVLLFSTYLFVRQTYFPVDF